MSVGPASLREKIETALIATLGVLSPPWQVSRLAYDSFPGADPDEVEALAFAVGLRGSVAADPGRQSRTVGHVPMATAIGLRFSSKLRADNHVADYGTALGREQLLVVAAAAITVPLVIESIDRRVVGDGTLYVGDLQLRTLHLYPLV